jgi:putative tricarboxylic transport membrane protein
MSNTSDTDDNSPSLTSNRSMEIMTALLFLVISVITIVGSRQIGAGWRDDGPAPGFFPFWVAVLMAIASIMNLINALRSNTEEEGSFVSRSEFGRVLAVLIPSTLYVALIGGVGHGAVSIGGLGIYVASFIFIIGFMVFIGREALWKALIVAILVPLVVFFMFEKWFKVALPKGPLEVMLGLA